MIKKLIIDFLREYIDFAHGVGLDCLVESHNEKELEIVLEAGADIIGINNRNLYDFSEDLNTTVRLAEMVPEGKVLVSESSIHTPEDIKVVAKAGIDAVLVGESFMRLKTTQGCLYCKRLPRQLYRACVCQK